MADEHTANGSESSGDELEALLLAELEDQEPERLPLAVEEPPAAKRQKTNGEDLAQEYTVHPCFSKLIPLSDIYQAVFQHFFLQAAEEGYVPLTQVSSAAFAFAVVSSNQRKNKAH